MKHSVARVFAILLASTSIVFAGQPSAVAQDVRYAAVPRRVVVNQNYELIAWSLQGSDATSVDSLSVTLEHVATREAVDFDFADASDGPLRGTFRSYDWNRPGRYAVYGPAYDIDFNELAVTPAYVRIKFDARATLSARRSAQHVMLRAVTTRYTGGYPLWEGHRKAKLSYQRFAKGEWRTVAVRTVPRNGVTGLTVTRASVARYRVVVDETRRVWGEISAVVRR
jgi:hypothetical protein